MTSAGQKPRTMNATAPNGTRRIVESRKIKKLGASASMMDGS
jgi:hypothetical protein